MLYNISKLFIFAILVSLTFGIDKKERNEDIYSYGKDEKLIVLKSFTNFKEGKSECLKKGAILMPIKNAEIFEKVLNILKDNEIKTAAVPHLIVSGLSLARKENEGGSVWPDRTFYNRSRIDENMFFC